MSFVLITAPFKSGILGGGFIRSNKVVPYLIQLLRKYVDNIIIYIPANTIRINANVLSSSLNITIEDAYERTYKELRDFIIRNNVSAQTLEVVDLIISQTLSYDKKLHSSYKEYKTLYDKIWGFGPFYIFETIRFEKVHNIIEDNQSLVGAYSTNENMEFLYSLYKIAIGSHIPTSFMMQLPIIYDRVLNYSMLRLNRTLIHALSTEVFNKFIENILIRIMRQGLLKVIIGVSPSVFLSERFMSIVRRYNVRLGVPFPANAVDEQVFRFRRIEGKEPLAVFFARLTPNKGIFELLRAWKIVEKEIPNAKLRIMGMFGSEEHKVEFFKLMRILNLRNVEFLGFIKDREELYRLVSESKVLIYPSHEDAFPLVVLESLALGVAVVAYNIPAIKYVYRGLPNVFTVPEYDYAALAKEAIRVLRMSESEYVKLHENDTVRRFLELHSSWENVARAEFNLLGPYIEYSLSRVRR